MDISRTVGVFDDILTGRTPDVKSVITYASLLGLGDLGNVRIT
jgi:hypothetical protein